MEQGLPRGAFSTAARLMGMMALMPIIYYWRLAFLNLTGDGSLDLAVLVNSGVGTIAGLTLAVFMISPTLSVGFIRRRMDWPGRIGFFLLKSLYAVAVPLHFILTVGAFPFFQPIIYFVWLGVGCLAATFFIGSVFPGDLARALARRDTQQVVDRRLGAIAAMRVDQAVPFGTAGAQEQEIYRVGFPSANQPVRSAHATLAETSPMTKKKAKFESDGPNPMLELLGAPFLMLGVALFGMTVHGRFFANFAPSAEIVELYFRYELLVAAGLGLCGYAGAVLYFNRGLSLLPAKGRWLRTIAIVVFYVAISYLGGPHTFLSSAPDLFAQLSEDLPDGRTSVFAVEKGPDVQFIGCEYSVYASWDEGLGGDLIQVCNLDPKLWMGIQRGQRLTLIGTQTPFGIRYHTVTGLTLG